MLFNRVETPCCKCNKVTICEMIPRISCLCQCVLLVCAKRTFTMFAKVHIHISLFEDVVSFPVHRSVSLFRETLPLQKAHHLSCINTRFNISNLLLNRRSFTLFQRREEKKERLQYICIAPPVERYIVSDVLFM